MYFLVPEYIAYLIASKNMQENY